MCKVSSFSGLYHHRETLYFERLPKVHIVKHNSLHNLLESFAITLFLLISKFVPCVD